MAWICARGVRIVQMNTQPKLTVHSASDRPGRGEADQLNGVFQGALQRALNIIVGAEKLGESINTTNHPSPHF